MSVKIHLGFEDENISEEYKNDVSYVTNKLGGLPDWPPLPDIELDSKCEVCLLPRPLVVQCYAPLPNSPYHRTLYIYACIKPSCWNNSNSWSCFRSQYIDKHYDKKVNSPNGTENIEGTKVLDPWCSGADEWGDDADITEPATDPFSIKSIDNQLLSCAERMSDDSEDDTSDMEQMESFVEKMTISNDSSREKGGPCKKVIPGASAEIDGNESEVTADLPEFPINNIITLMTQVPELPVAVRSGVIQFVAKFIAVEEEYLDEKSDHVKMLLDQYEKENVNELKIFKSKGKEPKSSDVEEYEKAIPLHGNELFHNFLTRVQMNPKQILRYSLGGQALLMARVPTSLNSVTCSYCGSEKIFELQILPTIIPSLKIMDSCATHLEFGTVLIYTCKKSCWKSDTKILSETVLVQSEPT